MDKDKRDIAALSDEYRSGRLGRREFIQRVLLYTGGAAAAGGVLHRLGFGRELVLEARAEAKSLGNEADIVTEDLTYPSGADTVNAYLAKPTGAGPFPTMIVIHEIFGLTEFAKDVARMFANNGYLALAPELLAPAGALPDGKHAQWMLDTIQNGVANVPKDEQVALKDAHAWLIARDDVDPSHLGSVGFCWGGARSFTLATLDPDLWVAVVFYGSTPPLDTLANIQAPVLAFYGGLDNASPTSITARAAETARAMLAAKKSFEWEVYNQAPHGFFRDSTGTKVAETRPAQVAQALLFDFLDRHA